MQIWTIVYGIIGVALTANGDDIEKVLIEDILRNYTTLERPVRYHGDALVVNIKFTLQQVVDVHERNQIVTTNGWLDLKWNDYHCQWNQSKYRNMTKTRIPYEHIWKPDILLYNNADNNFDSTTHTSIVIDHHGNCLYVPPGIFKSTCKIDVSNFPFDEQRCTLKFGVWSYNGNQVDLQLQPGGGTDTSEYIESGEWRLIDVIGKRNIHKYKCCPEKYVDVTFTVVLRRRTMYYVINLIIPCVLNSILTLLTFVLPAAAAEKITLAITVLLAQIVFMLLIMETMPPTSDAIPLISKYFACSLLTVCTSVGGTVLVLSFYYKSPEIDGRMSPTMRKLFLVTAPRLMHIAPFAPGKPVEEGVEREKEHVAPNQKKLRAKCNGETSYTASGCYRPYRIENKDKVFEMSEATQIQTGQRRTASQIAHSALRAVAVTTGKRHAYPPTKICKGQDLMSPLTSDDAVEPQSNHVTLERDPYFDIDTRLRGGAELKDEIIANHRARIHSSTSAELSSFRDLRKKRARWSAKLANYENSGEDDEGQLRAILRRLQRITRKVESDEMYNKILLEWQYASRVLDKILLWVFSLFVIVATLTTLFAVPNISEIFSM